MISHAGDRNLAEAAPAALVEIDLSPAGAAFKGWVAKGPADAKVMEDLGGARIATKKVAGGVAGRANVLIFPDLTSANIGFKLVQVLAGANTFGQIITGLSRPAAEISRGASAHDVFGAAAVVGCQAIDRRLLHGTP